jgi:hypothetical protein
MTKKLSLTFLALGIFPAAAMAQLGDVGNVVDKRCVNGRVTVGGMGNVVTVPGYCPVALIKGTGNVLYIERVGKIEISGTGNVVEYRYLNPNPKNPKTKTHPGKVGGGIGNVVSWTKGAPFKSSNGDDE